jgi:NAD(P)-dependent dehydrogenase (short-subunit alcohol dehydrogenase family)
MRFSGRTIIVSGASEGIGLSISRDLAADAFAGAIRAAFERTGRLDGLVNNAAYTYQGTLLETPIDKWRRVFEVNVEAPFVGMQAALGVMKDQGSGVIINIASVSGVRARKGGFAYSASKAALIHMGSVAAIEAADYGVRINTVIPGATLTESFKRSMARSGTADETAAKVASATIPLARLGAPEDVSRAVLFLLSDEASFITGESLRVEGGAYWTR